MPAREWSGQAERMRFGAWSYDYSVIKLSCRARRAVSSPTRGSVLPARRRVGRAVQGHWRRVTGAILFVVGTPFGIIAGWPAKVTGPGGLKQLGHAPDSGR